MQEEAESDCWLAMSGHWIIMGEADIMGAVIRLAARQDLLWMQFTDISRQ